METKKSRLRKMKQSLKRFTYYSTAFFLFYYTVSSFLAKKDKEIDRILQDPPDYYGGFLSDINYLNSSLQDCNGSRQMISRRGSAVYDSNGTEYLYNSKDTPILFIGGYPRSGAEIVVDLIKRHANLECMSETYIISDTLQMYYRWRNSEVESNRLNEAHVTAPVLFDAFSALLLELIVKPGTPGRKSFCNHEPLVYKYAPYVNLIFPNSKFLFIIRDGRAVVNSLIVEKHYKPIHRFEDHRDGFEKWKKETEDLLQKCEKLGSQRCLIIKYEDLLVYPRPSIKIIFDFLGIDVTVTSSNGEIITAKRTENKEGVKFLAKRQLILPKEETEDSEILFELLNKLGYDTSSPKNLYGANYDLIGKIGFGGNFTK